MNLIGHCTKFHTIQITVFICTNFDVKLFLFTSYNHSFYRYLRTSWCWLWWNLLGHCREIVYMYTKIRDRGTCSVGIRNKIPVFY